MGILHFVLLLGSTLYGFGLAQHDGDTATRSMEFGEWNFTYPSDTQIINLRSGLKLRASTTSYGILHREIVAVPHHLIFCYTAIQPAAMEVDVDNEEVWELQLPTSRNEKCLSFRLPLVGDYLELRLQWDDLVLHRASLILPNQTHSTGSSDFPICQLKDIPLGVVLWGDINQLVTPGSYLDYSCLIGPAALPGLSVTQQAWCQHDLTWKYLLCVPENPDLRRITIGDWMLTLQADVDVTATRSGFSIKANTVQEATLTWNSTKPPGELVLCFADTTYAHIQVQVGGQEMMEMDQNDGVWACKELPRPWDESLQLKLVFHNLTLNMTKKDPSPSSRDMMTEAFKITYTDALKMNFSGWELLYPSQIFLKKMRRGLKMTAASPQHVKLRRNDLHSKDCVSWCYTSHKEVIIKVLEEGELLKTITLFKTRMPTCRILHVSAHGGELVLWMAFQEVTITGITLIKNQMAESDCRTYTS
uniref:uncharacterized protein n=1 Tax=Myxine glutinosa TaxID=7769 RepID=UPI00358E707C